MDDDEKFQRYNHIPIPTYDEATSSRPSSSQNLRGPGEISDDAERQSFLPHDSSYRPPTVESPRWSEDSDLHLPEVAGGGDHERRQVEELDYLDPASPDPDQTRPGLYHRARLRSKFTQRLSSWGASLSSLRLPIFRSRYSAVESGQDSTTPARAFNLPWSNRTLPRIPDHYRMSAGTAARLCGLLTIGIFIYGLFLFDIFPNRGYGGMRFNPEAVRAFVQEKLDAARIEDYLTHITRYDHVAGTRGDLYMAEWMKEKWLEEGILDDVGMLNYFVYLNYPKEGGRGVAIVSPDDKRWTAKIEEEVVDPSKKQTLAWHGNSKSGEVEGPLIYANGGNKADFDWLKEQGVNLNGSIALMRYYSTQEDRSLKVKAAEEAGCIGALIYSDPVDDGSRRGPVWPEGPWRTDDSIQRGSVVMSNWIIGDPLTPGNASSEDAYRIPKEQSPALNQIPSLPLAWRDAKELIDRIRGSGKQVPEQWVGGDDAFEGAWYSGDASSSPMVHLKNINDEAEKQPIWNLHGLLEGVEQIEKKIFVGSHRDAWCFGSVDPGSGSAVLMEMVNIFGKLRASGWRPLRTIEFVSWDAEEYNMMGSTEYVEDNVDYLRDHSIAYLNVDVGVYGPDPVFRAGGSPMWKAALRHVLDRVTTPGDEATLRQVWDQRNSQLEGLGAGSDYVAFQDIAGTSSLDFGFEGAAHGYAYHSCYETIEWMQKFGDPEFSWHRKLAEVWALLILEVADRPILPFDLRAYADAIQGAYIQSLDTYAQAQNKQTGGKPELLKELGFDLQPLHDAAQHLADTVPDFMKFEEIWSANVLGAGGMENANFAKRRLDYNNRLSNFERDLLDLPTSPVDDTVHGLPGREQFKHILFGPSMQDGYGVSYFPFVVDAISRGNWSEAQQWVEKSASILRKATDNLMA